MSRKPLHHPFAHVHFKAVWNAMQESHDAFRQQGAYETLCLTGPSGVGKSQMFQAYRDAHPPREETNRTIVPVVLAEVPSRPTPSSLYSELLAAIGDPRPDLGDAQEKLRRFRELVDRCGTELILIDEVNHFLDRGRLKTHEAAADGLKSMFNQVKRPIFLTGAPRFRLLFEANGQFRNRFSNEIRLLPFSVATTRRERIWTGVLQAFGGRLRVTNPEFLQDEAAERTCYGTDGILRSLYNFLVKVDRIAGTGMLTFKVLEEAYRRAIWADAIGKLNPFHPDFALRRLVNRGEPHAPTELDGDNHQWDPPVSDEDEDDGGTVV